MNLVLLQAAQGQQGSALMSFLPLILIIVVFYFFMIRPQLKKTKEEKKYREELKKGDKIVSIGGIHGKIVDVSDRTFLIEVESGAKMHLEKQAVSMQFTATLQAADSNKL